MTKTLVIVTHPNYQDSKINKRWVEELETQPDRFTVHHLYSTYPDTVIDVEREQKLVESHDNVVFQFPVYWFNCPPLLKQWLDEVLLYGWAYGSGGEAFKGKKVGLAVSMGSPAESYTPAGNQGYLVEEILRPFELLANHVEADYQPIFKFHSTENDPDATEDFQEAVEHSAESYMMHLSMYFSDAVAENDAASDAEDSQG